MNERNHIFTLIADLGATDSERQEEAVDALVKIGPPAVEALITAVNDGDATICANAAEALGHIGDKRALGPLIVALQDSDSQVVLTAINALRRINDPLAVAPLIEFLRQDDLYLHFYPRQSGSEQ